MRAVRGVLVAFLALLLGGCGSAATSTGNHSANPVTPTPQGPQTTLVLAPTRSLSGSSLGTTQAILRHRIQAAGIAGAVVTRAGNRITVSVPQSAIRATLAVAEAPGIVRFRQALELEKGPAGPAPSASASASTLARHTRPLPGSESPTLTAAFKRSFASWDCAQLPNPTEGNDSPKDFVIACNPKSHRKYLLAPAAVEGTQVGGASSSLGTLSDQHWQVDLTFRRTGSQAWLELTKRAWETTNGQRSSAGSCSPPKGCNAVAIVLDGVVQTAPTIRSDGIPGGAAQITGNFTRTHADSLASILRYGALPAALKLIRRVS